MSEGIDYAWGKPAPADIAKDGYRLAARYLSHDPGKDLTADELHGLLAAHDDVVVVWETTADRALSGHDGGIADGREAAGRLQALNAPPWVGCYAAVDFAPTPDQMAAVLAYLDGFRAGLGRRAGVYGDYTVVKAALDGGHADMAWQTRAWSGTPPQIDPRAALYQNAQTVVIDGVSCDVDEIRHADYGGWMSAPTVVQVAQGQVGYTETSDAQHPNGNVTKYWAELDPAEQGQPWCAAFVSWCFQHAGSPLPALDKSYGFVYCPDAVNYAKAHGQWDTSGHYPPGAVIFYSFDGTGTAEHTGIVVADDGTTITTVEGNTSPDDGGSQANGGGVYLRHRPHGPQVLGVWHPPSPVSPAPPQEDDMAQWWHDTDGTEWALDAVAKRRLTSPAQREDLQNIGLLSKTIRTVTTDVDRARLAQLPEVKPS